MTLLILICAALAQQPAASLSAHARAEALLSDGGIDEAVAVLAGDVADPAAAALLAQTLLNAPPRPAWLPAAAKLRAVQPSALLDAWIARTRAADPSQRVLAQKQLAELVRSNPDSPRIRRMSAEARMFDDRVTAALSIDAAAVPQSCRQLATALPCAAELTSAGSADIAASRLSSMMPRLEAEQLPAALSELARLEAAAGQADAEITHLARALTLSPGDPMLRQRLLSAYLWQYRVEEAKDVAITAAEQAAVAGVAQVRGAPTDEAIVAAVRQAPTQPRVLAAQAQRLLEQGDGAAAAPLLIDAIRLAGPRDDLLNLVTWAATTGGSLEPALAALRQGLAAAPDAASWKRRLSSLSKVLVVSAEADKARGDLDGATASYALAAALTPEQPEVWSGYGGALWASGDLPGAEAAYRQAHTRAPSSREALLSLAGLLRAQGRSDEAYRLVESSSIDDDQIRSLEAELVVLAAARPADEAAAAGRIDEALSRYQALELAYPGHPDLLKRLADLRAANGELDEAIALYRQAQWKSPRDPWLFIGEARAVMAAGDFERAVAALDAAPASDDPAATAAAATLRREIERRQIGAEAADDPAAALGRYRVVLAEAPEDPWTLAAIGDLYAQDRQPAAALMFYDEALRHAPADDTALFIEGRVSALLALGRHDTALSEASAAYRATGEEVYLLQAREAERQLQLQRVTALIESDRLELAETSLRRRLEVAPEDTEARTVLAALLLATERPEGAFDEAATALRFEPGNADALTVLRRAGDVLDRADEVLPYYSDTTANWAQQEAGFLALDAALTAAVRDPEPEVAIATIAEQQAGASARKWVMVGGAWLEVGEPARAQGAFEVALSLDPHSSDAARGLAGALQARGEGERSADVLRLMWHDEHDPLIGQQLHALLLDLGRPFEARLVRGELERAAADAARAPASSSVSSLPVIATPSGAHAESAEPAPTPLETVMALQPAAEPSEPAPLGTLEVGVLPGQIRRPGTAGEQQLTAQFVTLGAEWTPPIPLWVGAAVIPMRISDGEVTGDGLIPGGWIGIGGGRLALEATAASTPLQLDTDPRLTGKLSLTGRPVSSVSLSLIGAQMAATDTTTSWFGKDGVGRAMDRWLGGELVWGGPVEFGLIGRFGETTAINIPHLPWQQGQAWLRGDFVAEPEGSIAGHLEGMVLQHDVQVGGFSTGEAAMFSPEGYYSLLGRVELERNLDRWGACAHGALGPQVITGEDTLYLGTGTWLGYRIEGGVFAQLTDNLEAKVGYRLEGTWGQWYQELAILQLSTRSHGTTAASDRVAMRLPAGSPVHGIPLTALGACGGVP